MFRPLLFSLFALAAFAPLSSAQDWNRRISDVHIVHPPATPPGTWTVVASVAWSADDYAPAPLDLGFDMTIELNGTPIDLQHCEVSIAAPTPCNWTTCNGGYCSSYWANNHHLYVGDCQQWLFGSGQSMCGCAVALDLSGGPWFTYLTGTDSVRVTLTPSIGSLPEIDTSDDAFTLALGNNPIGTPYCFGDGSLATACPCSNNGLTGHGCANSVNSNGAQLGATGWSQIDPVTGTDSVVLHGSGMPATSTAIYLKGSSSNANGAVFGDGTRCVAGQLRRMRVRFNVGGASSFPIAGDPSLSTASQVVPGSGVTAYYQVYYRDPASFCSALTYNITNAVALDW
jgi:hypothetical protein